MKFILTEGQQKILSKYIINEISKERKKILSEITKEEIDVRCNDVNLFPTDAQKEASNYRMAHISVKGMKIAIENPVGSKRYYGKPDSEGNRKYNVMKNHYGYFNVTKGKDGDAVDVFIGPNIENFDRVYCVDQNKIGEHKGEFDETKVMLGFNSKEEAKKAYMDNYCPGWDGFRAITGVSLKLFKKWLYRGRKQRLPFADYVEIKKKQLTESVIVNQEQNKIFNEYVERAKSYIMSNEKFARDYWAGYIVNDLRDKKFNDSFYIKAVDRAIKELQENGQKLHYYKGR